jgi:hypothetical protein
MRGIGGMEGHSRGRGDHRSRTGPASLLWSMKDLRHGRYGLPTGADQLDWIRWAPDDDDPDAVVCVIDDGADHCMVARIVGGSPDGCTYCLVARVKRLDLEDVRAGWGPPVELFSHSKEFTLCGVVEGSVSNVMRVAGYRRSRNVPAEYLPSSGLIEFDETS